MKTQLHVLILFFSTFGFSQWTQVGLDIDGEDVSNQCGHAVSINNDGTIIAIGAPRNNDNGNTSGHVRIYENINDNWVKIGQE